LEKWPYFVLAAADAGAAAWAQHESAAVVSWSEHGPLQRCAQAAWGLVFYVWKSVWPLELSPLYLLERELDPTRAVYLFSFAAVVVAMIAGFAWRKRWPGVVVAFVIYVVVVAPVLGFLQSGAQKTADRYTYLACIPFAALAAAGLVLLSRRHVAWLALGFIPLPFCCVVTWKQTTIWADSVTLFQRAVDVEPDNYFAQHNLAAQIRLRADRDPNPESRTAGYRLAVEHELASIRAHPFRGNEGARHDLGGIYLLLGEPDRAEAAWRECLAVSPDSTPCLEELQRMLLGRGDVAGVRKLYDDALAALSPNLAARALYATFLLQQSDRVAAERVWRDGLAADPRWVPGLVGIADCTLRQSRAAEAEALLRQAVSVDSTHVDAWVLLGQALRAQRKVGEAEQCWSFALQLSPGHPKATLLLQKSREDAAAGR
jgi:tetratricopeptide (TPR) repeat protein